MPLPPRESAGLAAVQDVVQTLLKALRDYRTYPRSNPIVRGRRTELHEKLSYVLGVERELVFAVGPETLQWREVEVYRNSHPRESLALRFYRHGVRELRWLQGFAVEELDSVLDALCLPLEDDDPDDDLVTLLWEREVPHLRWRVAELPQRELMGHLADVVQHLRAVGGAPPADHLARLQAGVTGPARDGAREAAQIQLAADEQAALQELLLLDDRRDLSLDVVGVLLEVLRSGTAPDEHNDLFQILRRVVEVSLESLRFERAAVVLRQLNAVAAAVDGLRPGTESLLSFFSRSRFLGQLFERLSTATELDVRGLYGFLVQLPHASAGPLTDAFVLVQDARVRRVMCEAIAHLVRDDLSPLAARLRHQSWFVPRNVAVILGMTQNPEGARLLQLLARHDRPRVRAEAFRALARLGIRGTGEIAIKGLADPEPTVRLAAMDAGAADPSEIVEQALVSILGARDFGKRPFAEKRALAVTYARVAGERAFPLLLDLLGRKGRGQQEEIRLAAASGLVTVDTLEALAALEAASAEPAVADLLRSHHADRHGPLSSKTRFNGEAG